MNHPQKNKRKEDLNDNSEKEKVSQRKKVLIGSVVVAAAIVAGSTFAWFSSKDEVTNRLTASADYNVSIVEDFQPPKEWIPGQTVNKDVAAVNTGNVDAFVRMWLGGQMRLLSENSTIDANTTTAVSNVKAVTDESKTKLGLNFSSGSTYYKTLSTKQINNPQDTEGHAQPSSVDEEGNNPARFSEVQSMQAGGVLVYAFPNAAYHWTLEQATDLNVGNTDPQLQNLKKGTVVGSEASNASGVTKLTKTTDGSSTDKNYYGAIDASTFTPESTGLYIFRRNVSETADGTENKYEYSGYYFVKANETGTGVTENTYFALHTGNGANKHSDYVLPEGVINDNSVAVTSKDQVLPVQIAENQHVYLFTATEEIIDNKTEAPKDLKWTYVDSTAGSEKFNVKTTRNGKDISIDIALANVGTGAEQWTAIKDTAASPDHTKTTFYYTNDVEAGDTTRKLVDSVKLSDDTQLGAYLAFDFDLNVFMDSVQVTMNEDGKEEATTVQSWPATGYNGDNTHSNTIMGANASTVKYSPTDSSEIDSITWSNIAP